MRRSPHFDRAAVVTHRFEGVDPDLSILVLLDLLGTALGPRAPEPAWRWAGAGRDAKGWFLLAAPDLTEEELSKAAIAFGVQ